MKLFHVSPRKSDCANTTDGHLCLNTTCLRNKERSAVYSCQDEWSFTLSATSQSFHETTRDPSLCCSTCLTVPNLRSHFRMALYRLSRSCTRRSYSDMARSSCRISGEGRSMGFRKGASLITSSRLRRALRRRDRVERIGILVLGRVGNKNETAGVLGSGSGSKGGEGGVLSSSSTKYDVLSNLLIRL